MSAPIATSSDAHERLAAAAGREQAAAPARQRLARHHPEREQRQRRADAECQPWSAPRRSRFSPRAASTEAAPEVGPTHGLHTAPSISPTANWPPSPRVGKSAGMRLRPVADRPGRGGELNLQARHQQQAADQDQAAPPRPNGTGPGRGRRRSRPSRRTARSTTNDSASPAASATGPRRCSPSAVPITIGTSGSTHGDSVDSSPASSARPIAAHARSDRLRRAAPRSSRRWCRRSSGRPPGCP